MIATPVVELGRKMPQLIGYLLPGQTQLDSARVERRVQRGAVKAADHDIRHGVIVPLRTAEHAHKGSPHVKLRERSVTISATSDPDGGSVYESRGDPARSHRLLVRSVDLPLVILEVVGRVVPSGVAVVRCLAIQVS